LSWRQRLEWIRDLIDDKQRLDTGELVYIALYLRFIGTGEVRCAEDGGHYRPSNHARISQGIYKRLSGMADTDNILIIRKIYPWLPSFDNAFMRSEPLTLIRDIAHRNDIPQELKKEIKVSLQNKLHRSAGPEDLATSASLLKRITATGVSYPQAFVGEFKRFHEELKAFFNARSLDEQLTALMKQGAEDNDLIRGFLASKEAAEGPEQVLDTFKLLTELRKRARAKLRGSKPAEGHQLQLIDIGLEDFSFVLLSRLINYFAAMDNNGWDLMLSALSLSVRNLRLSGLDVEGCLALESELHAWTEKFGKDDRDQLLRLKATTDRSRRLAEGYCDRILALFPERAERLGHALGVAEHAIKVFAEADIRSHPVFQLSKLATIILKKIRVLASLPPWDVIVPGRISGRVIAAASMNDLSITRSGPMIALLENIEGDEEVPERVAGIIVAHETPVLSHMAVRARQRKVVFAACDDRDFFSELKALAGKMGVLDVSPDRLDLKPAGEQMGEVYGPGAEGRHVCASVHSIDPSANTGLLRLDQVTRVTGGNKAFGARRLEELSSGSGSVFKTPPGVVIPFGVMEKSLHSAPSLEKEYGKLINELGALSGDDLNRALRRLKAIVGQMHVRADIVSAVAGKFGENERLMVRSSSNCEDGDRFSGAGVYDSIANVPPSSLSGAVRAVWASLWNNGAFMGRKNAGVPHSSAHMAVLIQQMLCPEYSFIMHTVNPVDRSRDEVYLELVVGLGETLASAEIPGSPYRMVFEKDTGSVRMLAFSSFSTSVRPDPKGGTISGTVDYSSVDFSRDKTFRERLGARLGRIGMSVESALGHPQDIEGLVSADVVYLVQSRRQHGLE
jgi:phosphoglucan,water dikinase